MRTIAEQWDLFEHNVLPPGAGLVQRKEMKRAFYAGAHAVLLVSVEISDAATSEDAGVAMFEGLHDECRRFAAEIAAGRA